MWRLNKPRLENSLSCVSGYVEFLHGCPLSKTAGNRSLAVPNSQVRGFSKTSIMFFQHDLPSPSESFVIATAKSSNYP